MDSKSGLLVYTGRKGKKDSAVNEASVGVVGVKSVEIKQHGRQELGVCIRRSSKKIDTDEKNISATDDNAIGTSDCPPCMPRTNLDRTEGVQDGVKNYPTDRKNLDNAVGARDGVASDDDVAAVGSEHERQREVQEGPNESGDLAKGIEEEESRISETRPRRERRPKTNWPYSSAAYLLGSNKLSSGGNRSGRQETGKNKRQGQYRGTCRVKGNTPVGLPPHVAINLRICGGPRRVKSVTVEVDREPPRRREMTEQQKMVLCRRIESLPEDKKLFLVDFVRRMNGVVKANETEFELDLDVLDNEILWEIEKLFPDRLRDNEQDRDEGTSSNVDSVQSKLGIID